MKINYQGIRSWDLNPRRLEHDSLPVTARPGLPCPTIAIFKPTTVVIEEQNVLGEIEHLKARVVW